MLTSIAMTKVIVVFFLIMYIKNGFTTSLQSISNDTYHMATETSSISSIRIPSRTSSLLSGSASVAISSSASVSSSSSSSKDNRQEIQEQQSHLQHHIQSSAENFDFDYTGDNDKELVNKPLNRGPYFDVSASKNVTALVGKTAYLNCRIRNLGNKTVTWIRHRDLHLLTVGKTTYTSDQRFVSVHNAQMGDWSLQVRYPQQRDSGIYECQVSTTPPVGYSMTLSVVEPITTIHGGPDLYIDTGSTVNLTCIVRHLPEPPPSIFWTHNNQEINYDSPRGGVSVITEKGDITTSYLLIQRANTYDSGKYTCAPSHANPQTVTVHVLNGEEPAAIQRGNNLHKKSPIIILAIVFLNLIFQR